MFRKIRVPNEIDDIDYYWQYQIAKEAIEENSNVDTTSSFFLRYMEQKVYIIYFILIFILWYYVTHVLY